MSEVLPFYDDRVLFATDMPTQVNAILQQAVAAYEDTRRAEDLLWQAQQLGPEQLAIYVALYKFYFYKNYLADAERVVHMALEQSATLGGFNPDWKQLTPASTDWSIGDGPQRYYLYSLKALGFIRLRLDDGETGRAVLQKLSLLDPDDQVGGSVLLDLAAAVDDVDG
jgi:hypothetical protein